MNKFLRNIRHGTWKWFAFWSFINFLSLVLLTYGINKTQIVNSLASILVLGCGVEVLHQITRSVLCGKQWILNKFFFLWCIVNSFLILVFKSLSSAAGFSELTTFFLIALGLVLVCFLITKMNLQGSVVVSLSIVLLILVFVSTTDFITVKTGNSSVSPKAWLNNMLSSTFLQTCPQLTPEVFPYTLTGNTELQIYNEKNVKIQGLRYEQDMLGLSWNIAIVQISSIPCRKGLKEGENQKHTYCGSLELPATYMTYQDVDQNGDIRRIVETTFFNEYDEKGSFVKTVCGKTQNAIMQEVKSKKDSEVEEAKRQIREFSNLFN